MVKVRCARSATKHGVSRPRIRYVIEHCGLRFEQPAPIGGPVSKDMRLVYLGDDDNGVALEVVAVELDNQELFVIHAMPMRTKYQTQYEEAKKWRR